MFKKVFVGFFLIFLFIGSTQAISDYASDQLALIPGSYTEGTTVMDLGNYASFSYFEYDTIYKVVKFHQFPDVSKKIVEIGMKITITFSPPSDTVATGIIYEYSYLVWYHNRSKAVPLSYLKITNGSVVVQASLMSEETFQDISNLSNMVVKLEDGREVLWNVFVSMSALTELDLALQTTIREQWLSEAYLPSKEQYAISPEVAVEEIIDYSWFTGEVVGIISQEIGDQAYDIIKVHIDYTESQPIYIDDYTTRYYIMYESDFFYEAKTGMIAGFIQYNETGHPFYQFSVDKIHFGDSDNTDGGNTLTLHYDYLFSILGLGFMVSLALLIKTRRK